MARPRKPTAELERAGGFDAHPERRRARENEPVPTGPLGDPPEHLTDGQKAIWHELAGQVPEGVLTIADRFLVEIVCRQMAKLRARKPLKAAEMNQIISCLSRMGLTPADRSRVGVPKRSESEQDPFAELAAGPRGEGKLQ
jgi:phage terminase small subunit